MVTTPIAVGDTVLLAPIEVQHVTNIGGARTGELHSRLCDATFSAGMPLLSNSSVLVALFSGAGGA